MALFKNTIKNHLGGNRMNSKLLKTLMLASSLIWGGSALAAKPVGITPDMMDAKVMHGGK